jgi:hypothetical protein
MAYNRRPRGSLVEPRRAAIWIEARVDDDLTVLAGRIGTTRSGLMQWLLESVRLDEHGIPVGWADTHPSEAQLPIDAVDGGPAHATRTHPAAGRDESSSIDDGGAHLKSA